MEATESPVPSTPPPPPTPVPPPEEGSAFGRMFNVLAAPGEVFAEIKERPVAHSNWLVPAITTMVVGIITALLLFSQDWAVAEIRRIQTKAMDAKFDEMVKKGKMKQSDADNARKGAEQFMEKMGPMITKIGAIFGNVMNAFGVPFFWGFVIWIFGVKVFKGDFEYMKAVEASALGLLIYALAGVLVILLDFVLGRLTSLSPAAFMSDLDFVNPKHQAIMALNPLYLWYAAVMATATSVLAGIPWAKAATAIFGFWIVIRVILIAVGAGQAVM